MLLCHGEKEKNSSWKVDRAIPERTTMELLSNDIKICDPSASRKFIRGGLLAQLLPGS